MAAVDRLVKRLTSPYASDPDTNVYKLLSCPGQELDAAEAEISKAQDAHHVDLAAGQSLDSLGDLLQAPRQTGEADAHYRARLKTQLQRSIGSATIPDVKEIAAMILGVSQGRVQVREDFSVEYAYFQVCAFPQDLDAAGITAQEFKGLLANVKGAGIRIAAFQAGTFTCRAAADPDDAAKGYDDIAGSNPGGGAYAGLL